MTETPTLPGQRELDPDNKTTVFISHRLEDGDIAKIIYDALSDASGEVEFYVANDSEHRNTPVGGSLSDGIAKALSETELVLLIYTHDDEDWSWCMWETGVATNPLKADSTRVVPISLTGEVPKVFDGKLSVMTNNQNSVRAFFKQFCTDPDFFPGLNRPLTQRTDRWIEERADALYEKIRDARPSSTRRWRRCDRFLLRASPEAVELMRRDTENMPAGDDINTFLEMVHVIEPSREVSAHFGVAESLQQPTLAELRARWENCRNATDIPRSHNRPWTIVLCEELWRICNDYSSNLSWEPFLGVANKNWLFPLVIEYVILPDGGYEFDIAFVSTLRPGQTVPGE